MKHVKPLLLAAARDQRLIYCMNDNNLAKGFKLGAYIDFINELRQEHGEIIMADMLAINKLFNYSNSYDALDKSKQFISIVTITLSFIIVP